MIQFKRAMSPLIATVFLLAFAVALGVMIMNWTPSQSDLMNFNGVKCGDVKIEFTNTPCYSNNQLIFEVRNIGRDKISGILINSVEAESEFSIKVPNSSLVSTESISKQVKFLYSGGAIQIKFVPLFYIDENLLECQDFALTMNSLPTC